jgi:hypothetical protein
MMALGIVLMAFGFSVYAWYTGGGRSPAVLQQAGAMAFVTGFWLAVVSFSLILWRYAP